MRRRRYLATATLVALPTIAGCSGSSDDGDDGTGNDTSDDGTEGDTSDDATNDETGDDETENGTDDETGDDTSDGTEEENGESGPPSGELPGWAEWVPAGTVTDETTLTVVDTDRMRREMPDRYTETPASGLADVFGFDEAEMDHAIDLSDASTGENIFDVVTGEFDREEMFDHLSLSDSDTESYREFEFIETDDSIGAFGESSFVVGPQRTTVERVVDTRAGDVDSIGERDEDWNRLFQSVDEVAMGVMASGSGAVGPPAPFDVKTIAVLFDAAEGEQILMTGRYVFESAERAETVLADQRDAVLEHFQGETEGTVRNVRQEGNRIVVTMVTDDVSFE